MNIPEAYGLALAVFLLICMLKGGLGLSWFWAILGTAVITLMLTTFVLFDALVHIGFILPKT